MKLRNEVKVGLFAVIVITLAALVTIRVGDQSIVAGGAYKLHASFADAAGLYPKASVSIAGVNVGVVKEVGLSQEGKAFVTMGIQKKIIVPKDSIAFLKTKGFLGEAFVEIIPGKLTTEPLKDGDEIGRTQSGGDVTGMVNKFTDIAEDVKEVTSTIKSWTNEEEGGAIANTVNNLDEFTRVMRDISIRNEENMDRILNNMADLTHEIKEMVAKSHGDIEASAENVASITKKIDEGRGTIGKLINDDETVEKLNSSLDSLNEALGGYQKMELGMGFHTEYLMSTEDYKNYISLDFWPTPDEALLVDFLTDPLPDTKRSRRTSDITVGGTTTRVTTEDEV
ncbi:MAG: MlaD family protein, partial [Deltaproteobacteria bacterium]|nr:MlaD family protein [Deltaproteobacteria bacterium]